MDILQMVPELLIAGYEDVISSYSLRIDNCPMNGDEKLILSQMKAKDITQKSLIFCFNVLHILTHQAANGGQNYKQKKYTFHNHHVLKLNFELWLQN